MCIRSVSIDQTNCIFIYYLGIKETSQPICSIGFHLQIQRTGAIAVSGTNLFSLDCIEIAPCPNQRIQLPETKLPSKYFLFIFISFFALYFFRLTAFVFVGVFLQKIDSFFKVISLHFFCQFLYFLIMQYICNQRFYMV